MPWKLFATPKAPITDLRLVLQDRAKPETAASSASSEADPDGAQGVGEEMARVMSANGLPTRYAGHVKSRADALLLPEATGGSQLLILVPTGGHGTDGSVDYVALLYESDNVTQPLFQSAARLGKDLSSRTRDVSATTLVNAFAEAKLLDSARHVIVPINLF